MRRYLSIFIVCALLLALASLGISALAEESNEGPVVDYTLLQELYDANKDKTPVVSVNGRDVQNCDYWIPTEEGKKMFEDLLAAVEALLKNEDAESQEDADELTLALIETSKGIGKGMVDKNRLTLSLDDAIAYMDDRIAGPYGVFSNAPTAFQQKCIAAVAVAERVLTNLRATQAQVDAAIASLYFPYPSNDEKDHDQEAPHQTGEPLILFVLASIIFVLAMIGLICATLIRYNKMSF